MALQFLTTIPVPGNRETGPERFGQSVAYFTVVGLIIGLILAGLRWLLGLLLPPAVSNVLVIAGMVLITGALHLDGFLDTCDGLAGHGSVEERWEIMHDSRAGGFGAIGVAMLLLVKYVSLANVPDSLLTPALVLAPVLGRWAMVYALFAYPYARPAGLGKAFKEGTNWIRFTVATAIAFAAVAVVLELVGVALMAAVWIGTIMMSGYLKSRFAGLTGDTYGAINEVSETAVFLLIIFVVRAGWA